MGKPILILFLLLSLAFLVFSSSIYKDDTVYEKKPVAYDAALQKEGRLIWQKNNCHVCHQLYGLGGFLGPDLTNVADKGYYYIDAFLKVGINSMPIFNLTEEESLHLFEFLKATNASGSANPKDYTILMDGMIVQK
ncbi:MAG: nitric-oxide reductase [Bacteroidetes bacterium HGW-Bacteroidetes-2]|jgi:nitric oxide reductase subunit C|nr:MAG: nitric-oxide reductase [Bacteroidetes bacterium HGW-Bacteroidetes-2]